MMNNIYRIADSFHWITPVGWQRALVVAALLALLVGGGLAHRPFWFPGPLTEEERARARRPAWRRWAESALLPLLAVAAALGIACLVAPFEQPQELRLWSRARTMSDPAPQLVQPDPHGRARDLGPVVDEVLAACAEARANEWLEGSPKQRADLGEILRKHVFRTPPAPLGPSGPSARHSELPRWVVESVETSVVLMALRRNNVVAVTVAPGPARGETEGWPLGASVMTTEAVPVLCVDRIETGAGPFIQNLFGATLDRTTDTLRFWALVEGRFPPGASGQELRVIVSSQTSRLERTFIVPRDDLTRRIQSVSLSGLSGLGTAPVYLSDTVGRRRTAVAEGGVQPPRLRNVSPAPAPGWKASFELLKGPGASVFAEFHAELANFGIPLPEYVGGSADAFLLEGEGVVIVARSPECAHNAQQLLKTTTFARRPYATAAPAASDRVEVTKFRPATVFSPLAMPVPVASAGALPSASLDARGVANRVGGPAGSSRVWADPVGRPLVLAGRIGDDRFVLIDLDVSAAGLLPTATTSGGFGIEAGYDPGTFLSLMQTVAWSARYVIAEEEATAQAVPDRPDLSAGFTAPVVGERDLQDVVAARRLPWDLAGVGLVGAYLAVLGWRIYRGSGRVS
jgi:hypothetical protein